MTELQTCDVDPVVNLVLTWGEDPADQLVIGPECEGESGLWWNSLQQPAWAMRYTTAPPSSWVAGDVLLGAVPDASAVVARIAVRGTTTEDLELLRASLETALARWSYTVSITVDDVPVGSWPGRPTLAQWGDVTPGRAGLKVAEAAVLIPVNPGGAP